MEENTRKSFINDIRFKKNTWIKGWKLGLLEKNMQRQGNIAMPVEVDVV